MSDSGSRPEHIPVLRDEVIAALNPQPGASLIDGTLGAGGHSLAWLEATSPDGRVLGFDRDAAALAVAQERLTRFGDRVQMAHASFDTLARIAPEQGFALVDAILLDLGFSSLQIDDPARGFAFQHDGPLDMRYDARQPTTAADLVNGLAERELAGILFRFGEERHARRIARAIVAARPIGTTRQLAETVAQATPPARAGAHSRERIHPATRTFQALRIAVNDELGALERALPQAVALLRPGAPALAGGRLAVISFHSLEDRIVKRFMRRESTDCLCPPRQPVCTCGHRAVLREVKRKPVTASQAEIAANPRARSAKLRAAERVSPGIQMPG